MTQSRDRTLPLGRGLKAVFRLTLKTSLGPKRLLAGGLLLVAPLLFVLLALLAREQAEAGARALLYGSIVVRYYIGNVLPLAALFIASALIADELEGRTLGYLLSRPISRPTLLLGRLAAYLSAAGAVTALALAVTYALLATPATLFNHVAALGRDLGVVTFTLVTYTACFTLLGVLVRRPLIPGLFFIYGWEQLANLPGFLPRLTLSAHLRALAPHGATSNGVLGFALEPIPVTQALLIAGFAAGLSVVAALWVFAAREYTQEEP
jgi:ABC-2 type transport system permease protein